MVVVILDSKLYFLQLTPHKRKRNLSVKTMNIEVVQRTLANIVGNRVFHFDIHDVPSFVLEWITAHPGQTAPLIVNGMVVFSPAAITIPLLSTIGFGWQGPVAGTQWCCC